MGPTDPNRYHMWTGWVGNDGSGGGPVITNAEVGYDWSTFPERLQAAGLTWKVYQDVGDGLDAAGFWGWTGDPYIGNFGDNSLLYFHQYQSALPGDPLADKAKVGTNIKALGRDPMKLVEQFRQDVLTGTLPQVSWIVAPEAFTEHPNWAPDFGAWYTSQFIDALTSNPDVWSKTVFFLNYDEDGGFFDHVVSPTPPATPDQGASTVTTLNEIFPGDGSHPSGPYGLGVRVPLLVISPWSKGGWVDSEIFDHTSLIKFIERRFADTHPNIVEPNITAWRRSVVGDLTGVFDFTKPNGWHMIELPDTSAFKPQQLVRHPDDVPVPPANQQLPLQERGVRPSRALPYVVDATASVQMGDGSVRVDFSNTGAAAVVFHVRSSNPVHAPRNYTVEAGKQLHGSWPVAGVGAAAYDLAVYGPNGFFRQFKGSIVSSATRIQLQTTYDAQTDRVTLVMTNRGATRVTVNVRDNYSGQVTSQNVDAGGPGSQRHTVSPFDGWYDFVVTASYDTDFSCETAGRLENHRDRITDPAMGGLV
jgi:phospholipase C